MPFQTYAPIYLPYRRKVYTKRAVTLLLQQEAYIPIYYKPLLEGRNLAFYSKYIAALSAIITIKTPYIIALKNLTSGIITIPSQFPIGYISKYKDSGYFVSSQDSTFPTLSISSTLLYFPSDNFAFAFPTINDKFLLDNKVRVVVDSFRLYQQPFIGTVIQQQQEEEATPVKEDIEPTKKLYILEKYSTLGLKILGDTSEITTKEGIYIYIVDL